MFCARLNPIHQHVPKRARVYVCKCEGKANYSWGLSWWFPSGSLARWIQALFYLPPSLPFWIQTFISHKVDVKECVLSFVSCPYARYERLSEKPVLLAYSCTSHSVAYLNVSRICKLTLINGFNRKDFLFLFHENKRQGINRVISIQALSNEPLQNSKHAICG